jgi:hypothetical protein
VSGSESLSRTSDSTVKAGVDFVENFGRGAIEAPIQSLGQLWDELRGKTPTPAKEPVDPQATGLEAAASRAGYTLGSSLALIGMAALTHKILPSAALESPIARFGTGAGLGSGYSLLFTPEYGSGQDFWTNKLKDAAVSGLTVGTIGSFRSPVLDSESKWTNFGRGAVSGFGSGVAGGLMSAEASSLLYDHSLASADKLLNSGLSFGIGGAAFGGLRGALARPAEAPDPTQAQTERADRPMPLPEGLTSDSNPKIGVDEFGNKMIITKDGLAATFKDGKWEPGFLFGGRAFMNDFSQVTDPVERDQILTHAADALRLFKETAPER